jgi:hypothetical protein
MQWAHQLKMKRTTRLALLIILGLLGCWWLLWRDHGMNIIGSARDAFRGTPKHPAVVDFLPRFRLEGMVNEALEAKLYDALSKLEESLSHEAVNEWPRFIWQTSPTKEETPDVKSWKIHNSEWAYKVRLSKTF